MSSSVKFKWGEKSRPPSARGIIYLFLFQKENIEFCIVCSVCAPLKMMRSCVLDLDYWKLSFNKPKCQFLSWTMNWISMSTFCDHLAWILYQSEMILYIILYVGWITHGGKQAPQQSSSINECIAQCWTECPRRSSQLPQTPLSRSYTTPNDPHWPQPARCPGLVPFFTLFTIRPLVPVGGSSFHSLSTQKKRLLPRWKPTDVEGFAKKQKKNKTAFALWDKSSCEASSTQSRSRREAPPLPAAAPATGS